MYNALMSYGWKCKKKTVWVSPEGRVYANIDDAYDKLRDEVKKDRKRKGLDV
jgi:hypothetical protein